MSMYRRPLPRAKVNHTNSYKNEPIVENSFLYKLLNPPPTRFPVFTKQSVYQQENYLKLLKLHYKQLGLPFVDPHLPEMALYVPPKRNEEVELTYGDRVYLRLRVLKNGIIRVKITSAIADVYAKYYSNGVLPPFKIIYNAYKSHGFSNEFLDRITKNNEKRKKETARIDKVFSKIFDKEPIKKVKKVKKPIEEEIPEEIPEDVDLDEENNEEDNTMDMELVEDDEELVEDEEYVSEPET